VKFIVTKKPGQGTSIFEADKFGAERRLKTKELKKHTTAIFFILFKNIGRFYIFAEQNLFFSPKILLL